MFNNLIDITIDKIYILTLLNSEVSKKRITNLLSQLKLYNLDEASIINIQYNHRNVSDPVLGCLESHMKCIRNAKENNYTNVLILEDDAEFDIDLITSLSNFKIKIPENFDMLYLGYNVNDGYKYDVNLIKLNSAQTTHAYILNSKCFDYILDNIYKDWTTLPCWNSRNSQEKCVNFTPRAIDLFYAKWVHQQRQNTYGIFPIVCQQSIGFSIIENKEVNYKPEMIKKSIEAFKQQKYNYDTIVINLDRRKDRIEKFISKYSIINSAIKRFSAIDGSNPEVFTKLKNNKIFDLDIRDKTIKNPYNTHNFKPGVLGCSFSHFILWNKTIELADDLSFCLILEDDITLCDNYLVKLNQLLDYLITDDLWDICYIGFTDYTNTNDILINPEILLFSGERRTRGGGTFGYIIRKKGAKKLIDLANKKKIQQAVDWFLIEQFSDLVCYKTKNDLVFSSIAEESKDSDVQEIREKEKEESNINKLMYKNITLKEVKSGLFITTKPYFSSNLIFSRNEKFLFNFEGSLSSMTKKVNFNNLLMPSHNFSIDINTEKVYDIFYIGELSLSKQLLNFIKKEKENGKNNMVFYNGPDLFYDDISFIFYKKINHLMKGKLNVNHLYIIDPTIIISSAIQLPKEKVSFYYTSNSFPNNFQNNLFKNGGVNFYTNIFNYFPFSELIFNSKTQYENFLLIYPDFQSETKIIFDNYQMSHKLNIPLQKDKMIISLNKNPFMNVLLSKILMEKLPEYKLITLGITEFAMENTIVLSEYQIHDFQFIAKSEFLIYTENNIEMESFFLEAFNNNTVCILSKFFHYYKQVSFQVDTINEIEVQKILDFIMNKRKVEIYKNLYKKMY